MVEFMDDRIKALYDEAEKFNPGSDDHRHIIDEVVKLSEVRNKMEENEIKRELETEAQAARVLESKIERHESAKQFWISTGLKALEITISVSLFVGLAIAESRGTFTNMSTKDLFKGMRFGIKR